MLFGFESKRFGKHLSVKISQGHFNLFFKGDHMWRGFSGPSEFINGSYKELEEHHAHLGNIDAAICLHHSGDDREHKHVYFFLVGPSPNTVFTQGRLFGQNNTFTNNVLMNLIGPHLGLQGSLLIVEHS